jgi:spermidine/putrescine transport system ATP-binding protein
VHLVPHGASEPIDSAVLGPGTVADVAFSGVSTEYLVDVPEHGRLSVFTQNLGAGPSAASGEQVRLAWSPRHAFALVDGPAHAMPEREAAVVGAAGEA